MTSATELAMNLADVRLRIRQLTDSYKGNDFHFDLGIDNALKNLTLAIAQSTEAATFDSSLRPRAKSTPESERRRHENWRRKQIREGSFGNIAL